MPVATPILDHNATPNTIYAMVLQRLPFITDDDTNATIISGFTFEAMWEMENCLNVKTDTSVEPSVIDLERVGVEANYTAPQRLLMANLVAVMVLLRVAAANAANAANSGGTGLFLKTAKAGSSEATYEQLNINNSLMLGVKMDTLLNNYKRKAMMMGGQLGCYFDITEDGGMDFTSYATPKPFIVNPGGCWNCGS